MYVEVNFEDACRFKWRETNRIDNRMEADRVVSFLIPTVSPQWLAAGKTWSRPTSFEANWFISFQSKNKRNSIWFRWAYWTKGVRYLNLYSGMRKSWSIRVTYRANQMEIDLMWIILSHFCSFCESSCLTLLHSYSYFQFASDYSTRRVSW